MNRPKMEKSTGAAFTVWLAMTCAVFTPVSIRVVGSIPCLSEITGLYRSGVLRPTFHARLAAPARVRPANLLPN